MNALIVDDELDICILLQQIAEMGSITSLCANTLNETREILAKNKFDFVFIDYKLPDGIGFDLIPEIRTLCPNATIIALSGQYEFTRGYDNCNEADYFITKPFAYEKILNILKNKQVV